MTFANPQILWLLALATPLLGLFLYASWRRKQKLIGQFVQSRLLEGLLFGVSRRRQLARQWLLLLAVASLLFALARPRWGYGLEEAAHVGRDVLVAIDVSRSMLAGDVTPDRITRAKLAAMDLAELSQNDRLGLIAFAGSAFLQCPLTLDEEAFRQSVEILEPGIIPEGGTVLSAAIDLAVEAFRKEESNHKALILITDGEEHEDNAHRAAEEAAAKGLRIFTVGVGTPNGTVIQIRDEQGNSAYLKDENGNVVKSQLNEKLLRDIANAANGFYIPLQGASAMRQLYERGLAPLPTTELGGRMIKQWKERFQIPLLIGIILLLIEVMLPERKKVPADAAASGMAVKAAALLLLLTFLAPDAVASKREAQKAYENQEFKKAQQLYEDLLSRQQDATLAYNAGAAAFKAGAYDAAFKHFSAATLAEDLATQTKAYYNSGNSLYRLGEGAEAPDKAIPLWEQALKQYESALKLAPQDEDARHNYDFVKKQLEELKKQQEKRQEQQPGQEKDNKNDQKEEQKQRQNEQQPDNQNQSQRQKENQSNQPEQQDKQDQQQQPQKDSEQEKQDQEQPQAGNEGQQKPDQGQEQSQGENPTEEGPSEQAHPAALGRMTPQQAQQLLEAQRSEERTLIFRPSEQAKNRQRIQGGRKDW